ncbi:phosphohistidine phosphatase SixA [Thalassolituus sp. LLYu03]|uniref:phosphohistidine phosphatase SixA n=1 Tax=Thalassolituus sp. LLYu03 TaxID=3421656 RepID=UPI003D2DD521
MKICIVRHGAAEHGSVQDRGRSLTDRGFRQADGAGKWLASQPLNNPRLIASPFLRTQQTAAAIAGHLNIAVESSEQLIPEGQVQPLVDELTHETRDVILVSHLPLVGHLAALLVDGQIYEQPWSPAEVWILDGDVAAAGCMTVNGVWYPVLEGI